MSEALLDKNVALFLKHETMLDEEREARKGLAAEFQEKMKEITNELEKQKQVKAAEFDENQRLRAMIGEKINEYKQAETEYQESMKEHQASVKQLEGRLKSVIDGPIQQTLKEVEAAKSRLSVANDRVTELNNKINGYVEKFEHIKVEMGANSKKFENYQSDVEYKKTQIALLETQIENIRQQQERRSVVETELAEDKKRVMQQVDTLKSLKAALEVQFKNLDPSGTAPAASSSNKENQESNL